MSKQKPSPLGNHNSFTDPRSANTSNYFRDGFAKKDVRESDKEYADSIGGPGFEGDRKAFERTKPIFIGDQDAANILGGVNEQLTDYKGQVERDLGSERDLRSREFARVLTEASGQRGQLAGQAALSGQGARGLSNMLSNPGQLSAGGQFQMQQAMAQGNNTAAAMGSRRSGATAAALQDRAQGIAQMDRASQIQEQLAAMQAGNNAINSQRFVGPQQDLTSQMLGARDSVTSAIGNNTTNLANLRSGTGRALGNALAENQVNNINQQANWLNWSAS